MICLLAGENIYTCEKRLAALLSSNDQIFPPVSLDMSEPNSMETLKIKLQDGSLFDKNETIVVRHLETDTAQQDNFISLLYNLPGSNQLVIFMPGIKATNAFLKKIARLADKTYIENKLNDHDLGKWVMETVEKNGGTINTATSRALIEWVGNDQMVLQNEIEKLVNFNRKVTKKTIKTVAVISPRTTIFQMLDAMTHGQAEKAVSYLNDLRNQRLDSSYIMSMICWQAHVINVALMGRGYDQIKVAKDANVSTFVLRKANQVIKNLDKQDVIKLNEYILEADYQLKTTKVDSQQLVEQLIRRVAFTK